MKNRINYALAHEIKSVKSKVKDNKSVFVAEIEGRDCLCKEDYMNAVWEIFGFPKAEVRKSWDGYYDWFTDLYWLRIKGKKEFIIFVYNYDQFLREDLPAKEEFFDGFREFILPWWEKNARSRKCRKMTLYLEGGKHRERPGHERIRQKRNIKKRRRRRHNHRRRGYF